MPLGDSGACETKLAEREVTRPRLMPPCSGPIHPGGGELRNRCCHRVLSTSTIADETASGRQKLRLAGHQKAEAFVTAVTAMP